MPAYAEQYREQHRKWILSMASETPPHPLYEQIVGADWLRIPAIVRTMHDSDNTTFHGRFWVRRGRGFLASAIAWMMRLPKESKESHVRLAIHTSDSHQQWVRSIGSDKLVSRQTRGLDGELLERFGALEFSFSLIPSASGLDYRQRRVHLCFGRTRIVLPRPLAPHVTANERASILDGCVHVAVTLSWPPTGTLLTYEGDLAITGISE
jgi:hypothetical protein